MSQVIVYKKHILQKEQWKKFAKKPKYGIISTEKFYYLNIVIMFSPESLYIFEGLSLQEVSYFLLMAQTKTYKKDDVIIREGDESDNKAYCIKSWSVDVYRGVKKITTLHAGDIFGELALITNEPRTATVKASGDIEVLIFNKDDFLMLYRKSDRYDEIKQKILGRIKENFYANKK